MLEDFRLKVFTAVAELRSFTKAAAALNISQPAVSQHVSELEKHVGVKLFERLHGDTLLTDAGKVFKEYADRINLDYRRADMIFKTFQDTEVNVSASEDVFAALTSHLLADFMVCHPEISFIHTETPESADMTVEIIPSDGYKGLFALCCRPSESFASTGLWGLLSDILEQD